jgi:hypothetical protein
MTLDVYFSRQVVSAAAAKCSTVDGGKSSASASVPAALYRRVWPRESITVFCGYALDECLAPSSYR